MEGLPQLGYQVQPTTIQPPGSTSFLQCLLNSFLPAVGDTYVGSPVLTTGPSICGLSSMCDCSHLVTGSPSLPDKYRHTREMMLLLPTHRDRPSSAMYPAAILENGQVANPPYKCLCYQCVDLGFLYCICWVFSIVLHASLILL